jgi:two-component system, cell cycle sensor histidine kinase and response regulator CckA
MNILLVDNDHSLRRFLKVVLKSGGFEVVEASNAIEALRLAEKHQIDMLVTDVVMAGMDGLILAHCLPKRLPVVFISGYPMDFEAEHRRRPRCAFLPKPFPANALLNTLTSLSEVAP